MITDNFLVGVAKAMAGETYVFPAYLTVSTDTSFVMSATVDTISGECGARISLGVSRSVREVTFSAVRSGAVASGEKLTAVGLFPLSSGGGFAVGSALPSLTHDTSFDIDFSFKIVPRRS